jgi:hypothetical protein
MDMLPLKSSFKRDITNPPICGLWGMFLDTTDIRVITYTLLCGYSPFRSEDRDELIEETVRARVVLSTLTLLTQVFHDRYWRDISPDGISLFAVY